jgi:hypothetical protein
MTLIELLISIALLGMLLGPITAMTLLGFASSAGTREKTVDSTAAQLLATFLVPDIQSSAAISTGGSACGETTGRLALGWTDPTTGAATTVVYFTGTDGGHEALLRRSCGARTSNPVVVVPNLRTFEPSCFDVDHDPVPCTSTATRDVVVDVLSERPEQDQNAYYESLAFTVSATRRSS